MRIVSGRLGRKGDADDDDGDDDGSDDSEGESRGGSGAMMNTMGGGMGMVSALYVMTFSPPFSWMRVI